MRNLCTALGVLASLVTAPRVLLGLFYVGLHEGSDSQPLVALAAAAVFVGLACLIAAIPSARSRSTGRYIALMTPVCSSSRFLQRRRTDVAGIDTGAAPVGRGVFRRSVRSHFNAGSSRGRYRRRRRRRHHTRPRIPATPAPAPPPRRFSRQSHSSTSSHSARHMRAAAAQASGSAHRPCS